MYIAELEITDLRSFSGKQSLSLERDGEGEYAGWTVFAGRNGAGKSTLLKALAASVIGPLAARSLAGTFPAWVRKGTRRARVATRLTVSPEHDRFQNGGKAAVASLWTGLEWRAHPGGPDILERWADGARKASQRAVDRGPWTDAPSGWFVAGYGPYRHLGPVTAEIARMSADPVLARLISLFHEGATLSEAVDWLQQVHLRALEGREGAARLRDDVLALLNDGLLPDGSSVDHVDSDGLWIRRDGVTLPLEQVSDGYRTVTAVVVDIARRLQTAFGDLHLGRTAAGHRACPLPGVVLIDEVDAHMHVAWQQKIGFWLTSRFPAVQFLVTTHSPFICQAASPRGIVRLPAPGEGRTMEHVDDRLFHAIVHGGADDAVMSELFGLEHAHSASSEALREQLAGLERKMLTGAATPAEAALHARLKAQLPDDLGEVADRKLRAVLGRGASL